jgi:predicted acylesterase/phospholipase RssA
MYFVEAGYVAARFRDARGGEREVSDITAGWHFGEAAMLEGGFRLVTVIAAEDSTLLEFASEDVRRLLESSPQFAFNLIQGVIREAKRIVGVERPRRRQSQIGLIYTSSRGPEAGGMLLERLAECGEQVVLCTSRPRHFAAPSIVVMGPDETALSRIQGAAELAPSPRRVFFEFYDDALPPEFPRLLSQLDGIYWFVDAGDEAISLVRRSIDDDESLRSRVRVVWLLTGGRRVRPRNIAAWDFGTPDLKIPLPDGPLRPDRLAGQGINRLLRHIRGFQLGLALAGGGARGMAHLGVLRALDRAGIDFDMMSGTSCGAMAGIIYAAGYDADFCARSFARDLTPPRIYRLLPHGKRAFLLLNFRTGGWDPMLRPYLHDWMLEELPIAFHALTVDLITCREVVRRSGDAVHAILESINLPVLSSPIFRDGMALVDGGVLNNLPSDALVRNGADFVVAVDVTRKLRPEFAGRTPGGPQSRGRRAATMETFFRVMETTSRTLNDIHTRAADVLIEPDTSQFNFDDFDRACELADQGEIAAEAMISTIRAALAALEQRIVT